MDIYEQLAQDPKFFDTDRGSLPAHVSFEWEMVESPRLVTLMVMTTRKMLEKLNTMPTDVKSSIYDCMDQVPLWFALENHPAWLRLMGTGLNSMGHHINGTEFQGTFERLSNVHQAVASIFDGKVAIGRSYQLQNSVTIKVANKDDVNSFAYYLTQGTQAKKEVLGSLREFVTL